jgi:N-acyl-D-amino-acid deacylase
MAPEPPFTNGQPHPRAYGSFARILGHYSRDLGLLPLEEAIRRMTSLAAERLGLDDRGRLAPGAFADVVVFDPATIIDRATFESPHQLAVGVRHVWVNGVEVIRDGSHTGATPGRFVRGPGTIGTPIGSNR